MLGLGGWGAACCQVESYVALARELGGTILCGGDRPVLPAPFSEGAFVNPCVIAVGCHHAVPLTYSPCALCIDVATVV